MNTILSAIAAAALLSGASAAGSAKLSNGAWTITIEHVALTKPADRARVLSEVRAVGLKVCLEEPTGADRAACADDFTAGAIAGLQQPEAREALLHDLEAQGTTMTASAAE